MLPVSNRHFGLSRLIFRVVSLNASQAIGVSQLAGGQHETNFTTYWRMLFCDCGIAGVRTPVQYTPREDLDLQVLPNQH